jgi:hypothetical protein
MVLPDNWVSVNRLDLGAIGSYPHRDSWLVPYILNRMIIISESLTASLRMGTRRELLLSHILGFLRLPESCADSGFDKCRPEATDNGCGRDSGFVRSLAAGDRIAVVVRPW